MTTVWKYPIPVVDSFTLKMPAGARLLHVAPQREQVCLWAMVDSNVQLEPRRFRLAGTGHPIDDTARLEHVGSFLLDGGSLVFHLFEERAS